ncbi:hypothetical protein SBF1_50011 [Candidatus Desulfosporosinus infrequens]|uniref:Uncharacterized protein n=1 Tax=Candidatus Desulfosporosinus infrequens TaxID=2043169 RepID=A0A2U3LGN6_9FIRM|nr:hypothetical protein SBF1_50011 [Candidatus Desulfosporosinus infrequens]
MNQSFETGLFAFMKVNPTITDFIYTDSNGNQKYQLYYIGVFDPPGIPYATFNRVGRSHEMDLVGNIAQFISTYRLEIYHNAGWLLLDLQQRIRDFLESLVFQYVGGQYIQKIEVEDDYHELIPKIEEVRVRLYKGVLDITVTHNPSQNQN